jgi:hypothetical protein
MVSGQKKNFYWVTELAMESARSRSNNGSNNNHNAATTMEGDDDLVRTKDVFFAEQ